MDYYLWIKALHLIAVIAFMAAILYLPRLFVYHAEAAKGSPQSETFKAMERRLLRAIMTPAVVVVLLSGIALATIGQFWTAPWLHAKLLLVVVLIGMHGFLARGVRNFAADRNQRSPRTWRILNEVPTVAMVLIVILVVVKPF